MELIVDKDDRVFAFDDTLRDQVWEPSHVTRFRFKVPPTNEYFQERLARNYPTAGIFYNNTPYIGTSDGFICTPSKKIRRIPEILVDPEIFIKEFPFRSEEERTLFKEYKTSGVETIQSVSKKLVNRIFEIDELYNTVRAQENNLDRYLTPKEMGIPRIAIIGFVIDSTNEHRFPELYDGHLLGITQTNTGKMVNNLIPHALHQILPNTAGFVPGGYPPTALERITIIEGLEKRTQVYCVDYRSLWSLHGQGMFVRDICPRDGSGYAPAKFATDGETIAISHGNHPCYQLGILKQNRGVQEKVKTIDLDPQKTPTKLLIRDGQVYVDYGEHMRNFSTEEDLPLTQEGRISSISESGKYTIQHEGRTLFYALLDSQAPIQVLKGEYHFLAQTRQ